MATIQMKIDKKGEVQIEVTNVQGASCTQITQALEQALGTKVDSQMKPEFFVELEGTKQTVSEGEE